MPTDWQLDARTKYIGSSESAALLGVSPWNNPRNVYHRHHGDIQHDPRKNTGVLLAGVRFEDGVLKEAEMKLGPLIQNQYRVDEARRMCATCDALILADPKKDSRIPVEAKTAGFSGPVPQYWLDPDGDVKIPDHVQIQLQHQMMVTGADRGYVAAFLAGGRGFQLFPVKGNEDLQNMIEMAIAELWDRVERSDPPPQLPSSNVLRLLIRPQGKEIPVSLGTILTWREIERDLKTLKSKASECKREALAMLGDAEIGLAEDEGVLMGRLLFAEEKGSVATDWKAMEQEEPEAFKVASRFRKQGTRRVPRWKVTKEGKEAGYAG